MMSSIAGNESVDTPKTPKLPMDLVIAILVSLPVKSLTRFSCVSKSCYALIKSTAFINEHLLKQQEKNNNGVLMVRRRLGNGDDVLFFYNPDSEKLGEELYPNLPISDYIKFEENKYDTDEDIRFFGSFNGIVCLVDDDCAVLCNPALREFKKIPPCPRKWKSVVSGEGFGPSNKGGFKFVSVRVDVSKITGKVYGPLRFYVYTSIADSWKKIDYYEDVIPPFVMSRTINVFLNNACHWLALKKDPIIRDMILSFDVDSEVFKEFECPDVFQKDQKGRHPHLMVMFDHIAVAHYTKFIETPQVVDVWVMKEYGVKESWTKQYVIGRHVIRRVFFSWKDGSVMVETTKSRKGRLASCAITTDEMENYGGMEEVFDVHGDDNEDYYSLRALIFKESLISFA